MNQGLVASAQKQPEQNKEVASQEAYDMAAGQIIKWLASDEGYQAAVTSMQADPAQGMANLIGRLLTMTNQSAYMAGKQLSANVLFQAGMEAAQAVSAIAVKEGILPKENEQQVGEDAFFDGLALFAQESEAEALTERSRQQFSQLIDGVEKMMANKGAKA